jgi:hypothetical protein
MKGDVLVANRRTVNNDRHKDDFEMRAGINNGELWGLCGEDADAELLPQLSSNCRGIGLTTLTLAAGKFPESAVSLVQRPLTYE